MTTYHRTELEIRCDDEAEASRMAPDVLDPPRTGPTVETCTVTTKGGPWQLWNGRIDYGTLDGPIDPGDA